MLNHSYVIVFGISVLVTKGVLGNPVLQRAHVFVPTESNPVCAEHGIGKKATAAGEQLSQRIVNGVIVVLREETVRAVHEIQKKQIKDEAGRHARLHISRVLQDVKILDRCVEGSSLVNDLQHNRTIYNHNQKDAPSRKA